MENLPKCGFPKHLHLFYLICPVAHSNYRNRIIGTCQYSTCHIVHQALGRGCRLVFCKPGNAVFDIFTIDFENSIPYLDTRLFGGGLIAESSYDWGSLNYSNMYRWRGSAQVISYNRTSDIS